MKKMNKKGFTIVELIIVIAVIAILAAVMIPTFGGIIKKANKSSAEQVATAAYKEAYALAISDGKIDAAGEVYTVSGYAFVFTGSLDQLTVAVSDTNNDGYVVTVVDGKVVVTEGTPAVVTTPVAPAN